MKINLYCRKTKQKLYCKHSQILDVQCIPKTNLISLKKNAYLNKFTRRKNLEYWIYQNNHKTEILFHFKYSAEYLKWNENFLSLKKHI